MRHLRSVVLVIALAGAACNEEGVIRINSLKFSGVESVDVDVLKSVLATKQDAKVPLIGIRLPWSRSRNFFDRSRFDADLQRIRAFYADRGFPDARVASFDVKLNDKQDAVDVSLTIEEGQPVQIVAVNFVGFEALPADHLDTLKKQVPLPIGKPRDRQAVLTAHEQAVNELRDHGYPYARVATGEDDGNGKEATITFTAEPGTEAKFGPIAIAGNNSVGEDVIRRQLTIKPGEPYRRSLVQDTQRRLYAMELFQFVNVEAVDNEQQAADVPMRVTVAEGRHQRVNGGIGYGTEEKVRVDGEYRHVNFLGGARSFGTHARWSSRDRGLRLDFNQPYLFSNKQSLGAEGQRWYTFTPAYESVVTGAKLSLVRRLSARTSWTVFASSERNVTTLNDVVIGNEAQRTALIALGIDPDTNKQAGTLSSFGADFQYSTTDNVLDARRGFQIAGHVEEAGRLLPGTYNYYSISGDGRVFIPVGKNLVLANRLQFGEIDPVGLDPGQVPFAKKYFLGGATSIRGWGRYEVSPLADGLAIGGNALIAMSSELRAKLKGNLGGVLFIDSGNVWTGLRDAKLRDLRTAAGLGLRYTTPVGPIRVDLGYQLNPIDGLLIDGKEQARPWRIHFSIGQAF